MELGRPGERLVVRPGRGAPSELDSVREAVTGLSQGMNSLVRGHLALARVEMARDLKALGKDAVFEIAGLPMLLASYLLLWFGLGFLLALAMPVWASFLICSGFNFLVGGGLMLWGYARVKREKPRMDATTREVKRDREWAARLRSPEPEPVH